MPLIYTMPGREPLALRKPPAHFVLTSEADLIHENSVHVYRSFMEDLKPKHRTKKLGTEELLTYGSLVGRMFLYESVDRGSDYFIRYQGHEIAETYGDAPEHYLSRTPPDYSGIVKEIFNLVQESRSTVVNGPALSAYPDRLYMVSQTLFMPVFMNDEEVLQILGFEEFFPGGEVVKVPRN